MTPTNLTPFISRTLALLILGSEGGSGTNPYRYRETIVFLNYLLYVRHCASSFLFVLSFNKKELIMILWGGWWFYFSDEGTEWNGSGGQKKGALGFQLLNHLASELNRLSVLGIMKGAQQNSCGMAISCSCWEATGAQLDSSGMSPFWVSIGWFAGASTRCESRSWDIFLLWADNDMAPPNSKEVKYHMCNKDWHLLNTLNQALS